MFIKIIRKQGFQFDFSKLYEWLTNILQRVSAWHNMIGPKLEAVELRKNFDIHEYGLCYITSYRLYALCIQVPKY